jgi:putative ABC transport system ATP-binding protein
MAGQETIIELQSLTKRYGFGDAEYYALRDFDLTVKRGEFIMVMGPSGCGKTTLLNIIGLIDKPTSGQYLLGNKDVSRISSGRQAKFRARQIGFIFQNFNLIPTLPVIENVALPLIYSGFSKYRRLHMASKILEPFHLQEREYYMPWQLSGGQQQRVAIARSLVANPSIILADEPTGNLDSRSSHIVMEELRDIHSMGNTIIMVTHNPALTTYATRVINMLDGQIDTDIKTVADRDLPKVGDPEKIAVRILPRKPSAPAPEPKPTPPPKPVIASEAKQPSQEPVPPPPAPISTQIAQSIVAKSESSKQPSKKPSVPEVQPAPKPKPKTIIVGEAKQPSQESAPPAKKTPKSISVKVVKEPKKPKKSPAKKPTKKKTTKRATKK